VHGAAQNSLFIQSTPVSVHGIVRNVLTGAPLARVLVKIGGDAATGTLTGNDGRFELPSVPRGPVPFSLRKPGFLDPEQTDLSSGDNAAETVRNVFVAAETPDLEFRLVPAATIHGHIDLSTSDPAGGISVHLLRRTISDGLAHWQLVKISKTNGVGDFHFAGLPRGQYTLVTEPALESEGLTPLVRAQSDNSMESYGFPGLYYPDAADLSTAQKINLQPGDQSSASFMLPLLPLHAVQATIQLPGDAPHDAAISASVLDAQEHYLPWSAQYDSAEKTVQTFLPDSSYTLRVSALEQKGHTSASGALRQNLWLGSAGLTVSGHDVQISHLPLREAKPLLAQLTIRRNENTGEPSTEASRPKVFLRAMPVENDLSDGTVQMLAWNLDPGINKVETLAPGNYRILETIHGSSFCEESLTANGQSLASHPLQVDQNGSAPLVEVTLRQDCASLTLSLPMQLGALLPGVESVWTVWLVPQFNSTVDIAPVTLRASSGGIFTLKNLTPGRYRVFTFNTPAPLEYRNPDALSALTGQEITLQPGGSSTLTVEVPAP